MTDRARRETGSITPAKHWGGIWRTRLARKIAGIFIISAAIPLAAFAALGYFEGGAQIRAKLERDLRRECRSTSLSLYERLLFLESELRLRNRPLDSSEGTRRFTSIQHIPFTRGSWELQGLPPPDTVQHERLMEGKPWLLVRHNPASLPDIILALRVGGNRIRLGSIAKPWIWSFEDLLPEGHELGIFAGQLTLFSSMPDTTIPKAILTEGPILGGRQLYTWPTTYGDQVSSFRDLFLARYDTEPWRVVQSTQKSDLLSPLLTFRDIFVWVGLLMLGLVTALSLKLIDIVLRPIHKLQETVSGIRDRDFSNRVHIDSGDEFEELGDAFNGMLDEISTKIMEVQMAAMDLTVARDMAFEALRTQSLFVQNVSHEFRTPTTSIRSFSEILRDFPPEDEATRTEFLEIIIQESRKLEGLVERVLDLSKLQGQEGLISPESFDPTSGLDHEFTVFEPSATKRDLVFSLFLSEDLPQVLGEEEGLKQVWAALLSNAIKFSPRGGRVELRAFEQDGDLVVEVTDEGCGIAPEHRDSIFESFTQGASDSLTAKPTGTGLGLTIAAKILEHHQGQIEVYSRPGRGSCFRVILPGSLSTRPNQELVDAEARP